MVVDELEVEFLGKSAVCFGFMDLGVVHEDGGVFSPPLAVVLSDPHLLQMYFDDRLTIDCGIHRPLLL